MIALVVNPLIAKIRTSITNSVYVGTTIKMTKTINGTIIGYSIFMIVLGVLGYTQKGSFVSIIAGSALAALMGVSLFVWTKNPRAGRIMSVVISFAALGNFTPKFFKSGFYPNGLLMIASMIMVGILVAGHLQSMSEKRAS
jgi:uncharacterized membrane protein (UPF0136 family)